jgi:hypothetical protein
MANNTATAGGAFVPSADYTCTGNWTFTNDITVNGSLTDATNLSAAGGFDIVLTATGATDVTLPTSGTLSNVANASAGVASGYKIARSAAAVAVTGTLDVNTGLSTVLGWGVTMESDPDGVTLAAVSAAAGAAGHITIKCWKVTGTGDATLIAATAAKNVRWVAIGT